MDNLPVEGNTAELVKQIIAEIHDEEVASNPYDGCCTEFSYYRDPATGESQLCQYHFGLQPGEIRQQIELWEVGKISDADLLGAILPFISAMGWRIGLSAVREQLDLFMKWQWMEQLRLSSEY